MSGRKYKPAALVGKVEEQQQMSLINLYDEKATSSRIISPTRPRKSKKSAADRDFQAMKDKLIKKDNLISKKEKVLEKTPELPDISRITVEVDENDEQLDPSREHHLDSIVQKLISQHNKEKETLLKDSKTAQYDLKAKYNSVLNSISIDEVKEMLANAVRENFELKQELLKRDAKFLELQLDQINANLRKRRPSRHAPTSKQDIHQLLEESAFIEKDLKVRLAKTEIDLIEKNNLLREVGTRMVTLEEKCEQLETENVFLRRTHENCVKSLRAQNEVLEKRCAKADARRKLESAGLFEEIRECKSLLKSLTRNVNKCAKLYSDARMEMKKRYGRSESLNVGLSIAGESSPAIIKPDRLTTWLSHTNPKVAQKAMSVWTEYLQRQVNHLEDKAIRTKTVSTGKSEETVECLYANQKDSRTSKKAERFEFSSDEDEESIFTGASPYLQSGKFNGFRDLEVPPSPTWTKICHNTGLNPDNLKELSLTENESDDD